MSGANFNSWLDIRAGLCDAIVAGQLSPGDELPSVRMLVACKKAHQSTVRKALDDMAAEGLIIKREGRSPVVAEHAAETVLQARRRYFLEVELPAFRKRMVAMDVTWADLQTLDNCAILGSKSD